MNKIKTKYQCVHCKKEFSRMELSKMVRHEDWDNLKYTKDGESIYCKECSEKLKWGVVVE